MFYIKIISHWNTYILTYTIHIPTTIRVFQKVLIINFLRLSMIPLSYQYFKINKLK